jgi:dolichol-phosphate mannosyltransferase
MAGIMSCAGRRCVVIDVDLQDPPELIPEMLVRLDEGYEVVYARRRSRKGETIPKRVIASVGYAIISRLSDIGIPRDAGDFRVMTRRVIEELRRLNETHGFLRGLVAYVGFPQAVIDYDRDARASGTGKYNPLTGSLRIGLHGIVSFSSRPLQLLSITGALLTALSLVTALWNWIAPAVGAATLPSPAIALVVAWFSGIQLLALGLIGEYVGRIYDEVKRRPMYIVDRQVNFGATTATPTRAATKPAGHEPAETEAPGR